MPNLRLGAQRIFLVGSPTNKYLCLPLYYETRATSSNHPSRCAYQHNFDIVSFDKSADRFEIYLDEKNIQLKEDKYNPEIIAYGFGDYRIIQDYPICGRATYLHIRKRKWPNKLSNGIFSYNWDLSKFDGTRLNSEFVSF